MNSSGGDKFPASLDAKLFYQPADNQARTEVPGQEYLRENQGTGYFDCMLCETSHGNIDCFVNHVMGKRHTNNAFWREYQVMDSDPRFSRMGDNGLGIPEEIECRGTCWFKCSLCDCMFYCTETVLDHCKGRRHTGAMKQHNRLREVPLTGLVARSSINAARISLNKGRTSPPPPFYPTEMKKGNSESIMRTIYTLPYDSVKPLKSSFCANDNFASCEEPVIYNEDHRPKLISRRIVPPPPSYIPRCNIYDI